MSYGVGKPRFISGAFDFTPDKFYRLVEREPISANIIRDNPVTDERKIIEKGQYLKHRYIFHGLTWEQITAWKDLQSTVITHQPHSDNGFNYKAIVMSAIDYKDKNPQNRVLEVILESQNYKEYSVDAFSGFYRFDGVDDYISTPLTEITSTGDWTISFWINAGSAGIWNDDYVFSQSVFPTIFRTVRFRNNAGDRWIVVYTYFSGAAQEEYICSSLPAMDTNWHHIFIERVYASGASVINVYYDNVLQTPSVMTSKITTPTLSIANPVEIGRFDANTDVYIKNRLMRDYIIYNKVLSAADRGKLYAKTHTTMTDLPTDKTKCLLWYKCNETAESMGTSPYTGKTLDSSTNVNHGTPTNITPADFCNQELIISET